MPTNMQTEFCPLCSKNGVKVRVKAYQINFQEAVFVCSTKECTWPIGYHVLLLMDRPVGMYHSKDWPAVADQFLADYLKKQRDSMLELSAYTPPQTPGNSKDAIHDTTIAGPSSLPVVKEDDLFDQQPSTSKSKPLDIPVIDIVCNDTSSFENGNGSSQPMVGAKSEKVLVIMKDSSGIKLTSKADRLVANPFAKHSVTQNDKSADIVNEKPNFGASQKRVASENLPRRRYITIGKKKSKPVAYKTQFDLFEDIKKDRSTNEQCKAKVAIKSELDLDKMKPNEIREVLFVNNKSITNDPISIGKVEPTANKGNKLEYQRCSIKEQKKTCQAHVNSTIGIEKTESVVNSLIQVLDGDSNDVKLEENVSLDSSSKQSSNNHTVHYDLDTLIKTSPTEFESGESWSGADQNLESLLAMLEDDTPADNLIIFSDQLNDNPSTSIATLSNLPLKDNVTDNTMTVDDQLNDNPSNSITTLPSLISVNDRLNDNPSTTNAILPTEPFKDKDSDVDESKDEKMEVDTVKKEIDLDSIIENDTLECYIEDSNDSFFASLFSPVSKSTNEHQHD